MIIGPNQYLLLAALEAKRKPGFPSQYALVVAAQALGIRLWRHRADHWGLRLTLDRMHSKGWTSSKREGRAYRPALTALGRQVLRGTDVKSVRQSLTKYLEPQKPVAAYRPARFTRYEKSVVPSSEKQSHLPAGEVRAPNVTHQPRSETTPPGAGAELHATAGNVEAALSGHLKLLRGEGQKSEAPPVIEKRYVYGGSPEHPGMWVIHDYLDRWPYVVKTLVPVVSGGVCQKMPVGWTKKP
jgi:hypothetical protein